MRGGEFIEGGSIPTEVGGGGIGGVSPLGGEEVVARVVARVGLVE